MATPARRPHHRPQGPVFPSVHEANLARQASRILAPLAHRDLRAIIDAKGEVAVVVPAAAMHALVAMLTEFARGNGVSIVPVEAELTTQEAADVLGVSRPFLVKEIDAGKIPVRMVGTHRRIRLTDLERYRDTVDATRERVLNRLTKQAQDLDMGY